MESPFDNMQKWRCGNCGSWNTVAHTECKSCGAPIQNFDAIQKFTKITPTEQRFYTATAPAIVREINTVALILHEVLDELTALRKEINDAQKK